MIHRKLLVIDNRYTLERSGRSLPGGGTGFSEGVLSQPRTQCTVAILELAKHIDEYR